MHSGPNTIKLNSLYYSVKLIMNHISMTTKNIYLQWLIASAALQTKCYIIEGKYERQRLRWSDGQMLNQVGEERSMTWQVCCLKQLVAWPFHTCSLRRSFSLVVIRSINAKGHRWHVCVHNLGPSWFFNVLTNCLKNNPCVPASRHFLLIFLS